MTIRAKFKILIVALGVTALILGVGTLFILKSLGENLSIYEKEIADYRAIQYLSDTVEQVRSSLVSYALTGQPEYKSFVKAKLPEIHKKFKDIEPIVTDKSLASKVSDDIDSIGKLSENILSGADRKDVIRSATMVEMLDNEIHRKLDLIRDEMTTTTSSNVQMRKKTRMELSIYLMGLMFASFLFTVMISAMMRNALKEPYSEMLAATERVAANDLSYRIGSKRKDEFGIIAGRFDGMVESLEASDYRLKLKLKETELLLDVARIAGTLSEGEKSMKKIVVEIASKMSKDFCAVYLLEDKLFRLDASNAEGVELLETISLDSAMIAPLMTGMRPIVENDADGSSLGFCPDCRSYMIVPVLHESMCIGLLLLGKKTQGGFTGDEADTATIIAHTIGVTVRNIELYGETTRQVRQLRILYGLSKSLASGSTLDEIFKNITIEITKFMNAKGAIIRILEDDLLKIKSFTGPIEQYVEDMALPLGSGLAGKVAAEGKSMYIEDMSKVTEDFRVPIISAKTAICVPLKVADKVIGTLGLYDKLATDGNPTPFTHDDLAVTEGFAAMAAIAIEKARIQELEQKREREVLEANKRLDMLFESVQGGLVSLDKDYKVIAANQYVQRWIDVPMADIIGKNALDVFHKREGICPHCVASLTYESKDINTITQSSGLNYAELTSYPIKNEFGEVTEAVVFIQDITDTILYQEEIMGLYREVAQTKDYLESLINNSADAIVSADLFGIITSWNPAAEMIYGFKSAEAVGKFLPFVPDYLADSERENIEKVKNGEMLDFETVRLKNDGSRIEVSVAMSPIKDAGGQIIGISSISRNVTERKRIEKELVRRNQELSRLFFISTTMRGTLELDRLLRMVLTAVTMSEGLGFNRAVLFLVDETTNKIKGTMGVGPATAEEAWQIWDKLTYEKKSLPEMMMDIEKGPLRKDSFLDRLSTGIEIDMNDKSVIARAARDKTAYVVDDVAKEPEADIQLIQLVGTQAYAAVPLVARDRTIGILWVDNLFNKKPITDEDIRFLSGFSNQIASAIESARLFQQVSLAEAELENIFSSISDMVYFTDKDYVLKRVNDAVVSIIGKPATELVGMKCYQVFHAMNEPWSKCPHRKTVETLRSHIEEIEDPIFKKTFLTSTSPIFDNDRNFIGTVHIVRDISELKQLREKLAVSERMAALGEVAAKVAHEIRNPLVSIGGFAKRLSGKLEGQLQEYADIISKEVTRLESILKDILGFVKETRLSRKRMNINDLMSELAKLMNAEIAEKGNKLVQEFNQEGITVFIDFDRMKEAMLNIIANANQATDNGRIGIKTYVSGDTAVVEISDTGSGIRPEDRIRIFDPFFTTRPTGTGLGLAISRRIVEEHGGSIRLVTDWPGGGTVFHINIPKKEAS